MVRLLSLFALVVALGSPLTAATAQDIQGRWAIDVDAMWEQSKKDIPEEQHEMARSMMLPMMKQMLFEIDAKSVTVSGPNGMSQTGDYTVTKIEGDDLTLETTQNDTVQTMVCTVTAAGLLLTNPAQPGRAIQLVRAPAATAAPEAAPAPAPATP